ncbi:MAG: YtxH domain-containing protein [Candidatus Bruticola sp.]
MSKNNDGIGFLVGLLAGTALGVSVGMILAPRSGKESRRLLNDKFEIYRRRAAEAASEIQANTSEVLAQGRRYYDNMREHYNKAKSNQNQGQSIENPNPEQYAENSAVEEEFDPQDLGLN